MAETLSYSDLHFNRGNSGYIKASRQCPGCPFCRQVEFPQETTKLGIVLDSTIASICLLGKNWRRLLPQRNITRWIDCPKLSTPTHPINKLCQQELNIYQNPTVGIKISDLTKDVMKKVIQIYDTWVGGNGMDYWHADSWNSFIGDNDMAGGRELRYGSWATGDSKLKINPYFFRGTHSDSNRVLYFEYSDNGATDKRFARRLAIQFNYQIDKYFRESQFAVDLIWDK